VLVLHTCAVQQVLRQHLATQAEPPRSGTPTSSKNFTAQAVSKDSMAPKALRMLFVVTDAYHRQWFSGCLPHLGREIITRMSLCIAICSLGLDGYRSSTVVLFLPQTNTLFTTDSPALDSSCAV
jgi:hypothetical protein